MNKRGQFFLIAALVIVTTLIELSTVYISTTSPNEDTQVFDISEEINQEAAQVIFNGYESGNTQDIDNNIRDLVSFYAKTNPESDIAVYYGDQDKVQSIVYESDQCDPSPNQNSAAPIFSIPGDDDDDDGEEEDDDE